MTMRSARSVSDADTTIGRSFRREKTEYRVICKVSLETH